MTTQNSAIGDEELWRILADYSNDLHNLKKRDGMLPAQAAIARIKSRDQQIALAARMDELEKEDDAERELFRNGKNPDTSGYRDERLEELKQAQNKEK